MNGVRFLAIVRDRFPRIARIALSGMIDVAHFLKPAKPLTDHYLCKPCTPERLRSTILQAAASAAAAGKD
jgi:YesN/AraC family two-component response regulator